MSNFRPVAHGRSHIHGHFGGVGALFASALTQLGAWRSRSAERRQLAALSPHLLKDLGIGPADAAREVSKPFWRR